MGVDKTNIQIRDVIVTNLKQIIDERGAVFHIMKKDSPTFNGFGEAYISKINHNVVKGWKFHKKMKQNFTVVFGSMKLVLYDDRKNSPTFGEINEIYLDDSNNYYRVTIPEKIWYSFQCLSTESCLLLNIANIQHDPKECINLDLENSKIPYNWQLT
jgi:dTDP-4-dehydrorhamnose 3,5-epimerase